MSFFDAVKLLSSHSYPTLIFHIQALYGAPAPQNQRCNHSKLTHSASSGILLESTAQRPAVMDVIAAAKCWAQRKKAEDITKHE